MVTIRTGKKKVIKNIVLSKDEITDAIDDAGDNLKRIVLLKIIKGKISVVANGISFPVEGNPISKFDKLPMRSYVIRKDSEVSDNSDDYEMYFSSYGELLEAFPDCSLSSL